MKKIYITLFLSVFLFTFSFAQYAKPLDIPMVLSGNFGELRNNHFHAGIDIKTQGKVDKPVFSMTDGYVSRISVSPAGYGLALYVDHLDGTTAVYGHLNCFSKKIAAYVIEKQYEQESYRVNLYPEKNELPVKRGEKIALSGNTGGSGGPHLHLEIRDTQTEEPMEPLNFLGNYMKDTRAPEIRGIAFYPVLGKGEVNGSGNPVRLHVRHAKSGVPLRLSQIVSAWGKIGVGVKAYDRMNGVHNIYGVKHIRLFVDNKKVFESNINRFSYNHTRMLNSFIDFEMWRNQRSFYMKSFVEPGNLLAFYNTIHNGYIDIDEQRNYNLKYELEDYYGNIETYRFIVRGKKSEIPEAFVCDNFMSWRLNNTFFTHDFSLTIPVGNLYDDFCFTHAREISEAYYSDIHLVNSAPIPLHKSAKMWIQVKNASGNDFSRLGIVKLNQKKSDEWLGGTYKNGGFETDIRELGDRYVVDVDTIAPKIDPVSPKKWKQHRCIRIRLSDDKSGIKKVRGTIDDQFVLFKYDIKSSIYTYRFDPTRLKNLPVSVFEFIAVDRVGNEAYYRYRF